MAGLLLAGTLVYLIQGRPTSDALGAVSGTEARAALVEIVDVAAAQTPAAMDQLCAMTVGKCFGLTGSIRYYPQSAPGRDAAAPTVLCTRDLHDEGTRLLVVEGEDGYGRPYVSQLVSERDGRVLLEREPGFWLGVVSSSGDKFTGAASWTSMYDASATSGPQSAERLEALTQQARTPCTNG